MNIETPLIYVWCVAGCFFLTAKSYAQPPIVLRDLTLIRNTTVVDFDVNRIVLSNDRELSWDEILKAEIPDGRQLEFDQLIHDVGLPWVRLKIRIQHGDWLSAGAIAEPIFRSYGIPDQRQNLNASSNIDNRYLVSLATMKSRLHRGQRARAIVPFIVSAELQPNISKNTSSLVGDGRLTAPIIRRFLADEILPVWFRTSDLVEVSDDLMNRLKMQVEPRPGTMIYLASLQIETGQQSAAQDLIQKLKLVNDPQIVAWSVVLDARLKQKTGDTIGARAILESNVDALVGSARVAGLYYLGLCLDRSDSSTDIERAKSVLTLLEIPALHGDAYPEIAAAALHHSAAISKLRGRLSDEKKLRRELLKRFPHTYHGAMEKLRSNGREDHQENCKGR